MYELKNNGKVNLLGPGPRLVKKSIYWAAVSQMLRNTVIHHVNNYYGVVEVLLLWIFLKLSTIYR